MSSGVVVKIRRKKHYTARFSAHTKTVTPPPVKRLSAPLNSELWANCSPKYLKKGGCQGAFRTQVPEISTFFDQTQVGRFSDRQAPSAQYGGTDDMQDGHQRSCEVSGVSYSAGAAWRHARNVRKSRHLPARRGEKRIFADESRTFPTARRIAHQKRRMRSRSSTGRGRELGWLTGRAARRPQPLRASDQRTAGRPAALQRPRFTRRPFRTSACPAARPANTGPDGPDPDTPRGGCPDDS